MEPVEQIFILFRQKKIRNKKRFKTKRFKDNIASGVNFPRKVFGFVTQYKRLKISL